MTGRLTSQAQTDRHDRTRPHPVFRTVAEVAEILRVDEEQVRVWCRKGKLTATRPGRAWLIPQAQVDAFIARGWNTAPVDEDVA